MRNDRRLAPSGTTRVVMAYVILHTGQTLRGPNYFDQRARDHFRGDSRRPPTRCRSGPRHDHFPVRR
jgi:hypothetical protein